MTQDIEGLVRQLAEVDEQLRALPSDAFADRHELLKQRDALRNRAASVAVDADRSRSDEDLLAELSGLRSQLHQIESQGIDLVTQAGGGASGMGNMGNLGGVSLNARMKDASGAGRIQARIGILKGVLTDRGVAIPDPK